MGKFWLKICTFLILELDAWNENFWPKNLRFTVQLYNKRSARRLRSTSRNVIVVLVQLPTSSGKGFSYPARLPRMLSFFSSFAICP